jgi:hypothetical protein
MQKQMQLVTDQLVRLSTEYAKKLGIELPIKFTADVAPDTSNCLSIQLSYAVDMPAVLTALHFVLERDEYEITLEEWCDDREVDQADVTPYIDQATALVPLHMEALGWIDLLFYLCGTCKNEILPEYRLSDSGYYFVTVTKDGVEILDDVK